MMKSSTFPTPAAERYQVERSPTASKLGGEIPDDVWSPPRGRPPAAAQEGDALLELALGLLEATDLAAQRRSSACSSSVLWAVVEIGRGSAHDVPPHRDLLVRGPVLLPGGAGGRLAVGHVRGPRDLS